MRKALYLLPFSIIALVATGCATLGGGNGTALPNQLSLKVTVTGPASTRLGASSVFTATVFNSSSPNVTWQVNGTTGGSKAIGTISSSGVYTAPATMPSGVITITASAASNAGVSAYVTETLLNPVPVVKAVAATQVGSSLNALVDVVGTGFVASSTLQIGGAAVSTTFVSPTELQATVPVATGTTTLIVTVANPDPGAANSSTMTAKVTLTQMTPTSAARLLDQATFGPTLDAIQHVQSVGIDKWLNEQFATPTTPLAAISPNPLPSICYPSGSTYPCAESEWWQTVITGQDQLRQRIAFALSEMFVVSTQAVTGQSIPTYHNIIADDAFGNYRTMLQDVTLSAAMGQYLNMLNSAKAPAGQIANENYAREMMQLFTTGIYLLNPDGTQAVDGSGNPVPVYTQDQVQAFARAYTGWTHGVVGGGVPPYYPGPANWVLPMTPFESKHDTSAKALLNGVVLPAGQTTLQDLNGALDNIFNHPNVGPFVCKQLIQHLATSNPSPAYVRRVADVFSNNGSGVRGDLKAVVRAILTDQEARAGDVDATVDGGHLREPALFITAMMRGFQFQNTIADGSYVPLSTESAKLNQEPYRANSVFNFFAPDYIIPGTTLTAPEFGIENTATVLARLTLADEIASNTLNGFSADFSDISAWGKLAATPGDLVDSLGLLLMHSQMTPAMRTIIVNAITPLSSNAQRVRMALYLIITSSQYKVIH